VRSLTLKADPKGRMPHGRVFNVEMIGQAAGRQIEVSGEAVTVRFER
jgi:hypothetical protein